MINLGDRKSEMLPNSLVCFKAGDYVKSVVIAVA